MGRYYHLASVACPGRSEWSSRQVIGSASSPTGPSGLTRRCSYPKNIVSVWTSCLHPRGMVRRSSANLSQLVIWYKMSVSKFCLFLQCNCSNHLQSWIIDHPDLVKATRMAIHHRIIHNYYVCTVYRFHRYYVDIILLYHSSTCLNAEDYVSSLLLIDSHTNCYV